MSLAAITLDKLSIYYQQQPALLNISGTFAAGSLTAIAGPNGAGKSTLLKALMGELSPSQGHVSRGHLKRRDLGYLPQAADINRQFPLTVADSLLLGLWHQTGVFGGVSAQMAQNAELALKTVGLDGMAKRTVGSLSAGQFQRVLFARLLLQDAKVIVLDEPFTAIDERTTQDLLALVHQWHQQGRTIIAVLHDLEQIREHFPQTLLMARELIAWGPTPAVLNYRNLHRARALASNLEGAA
nr:metal ABC transporter ATP-binding protein [Gallaecimonas mangrovi]